MESFGTRSIPKQIFTFWHDLNDIPNVVQLCINTWRHFNPNYKLIILDLISANRLCGVDFMALTPRNQSNVRICELIRLCVIYKFGGVWIDSSIICLRPLLEWLEQTQITENPDAQLYEDGMSEDPIYPIIGSWCFAAPKDSEFMKDWYFEVLRMSSSDYSSDDEYISEKVSSGVPLQGCSGTMPYLIVLYIPSVLFHRKKYDCFIRKSTPYSYLTKHNWDTKKAIDFLCTNPVHETEMIKLRNPERTYLIEHPEKMDAILKFLE
jgi:hypothetical protein